MLCISPSGWSPRIYVSPWLLGTCSSSGCGELSGSTSWWWGMRSKSCSNYCCSISVSICSSDCSISWEKSCSCDGSPSLLGTNSSDESTTCMGIVSSVCTCYTPAILVLNALPSLICVAPIPSRVSPSTHANPSLFPPSSVFLSAFAQSSCHVVSYLPLLPKLLFTQVGMLKTCSFSLSPCCWQSSSCPSRTLVFLPLLLLLLVLSEMFLRYPFDIEADQFIESR